MRILVAHPDTLQPDEVVWILTQFPEELYYFLSPSLGTGLAPSHVWQCPIGDIVLFPQPWTLVEAKMFSKQWHYCQSVGVYELPDDALPEPGRVARPDLQLTAPA